MAEVREREREHLMPMTTPFDGYVEEVARVSSTCLVAVTRNRYSVPCELAGQRKPGALRNGAPFADLPEPLQRLRRSLLREVGGDRLMAKVLALVPSAGLDAVLVAVELTL